jgi:hypothetical protein
VTTESLLNEMKVAFPPTKMPSNQELRFHAKGCLQCEFLANDLDDFRGKTIDGAAIRHIHQEMSCLSAKGWAWVLPHYLPYCLTSEAEYNQMETEFLLYNLSPAKKFEADTRKRLSLLSQEQIKCLIHFVEWLQEHPHWSTYCPEEIKSAQEFLHAIDA